MKKLTVIIILITCLTLVVLIVLKRATKSEAQQTPTTEVVDYLPSVHSSNTQQGGCWTGSNIASSNPYAYRCSVEHSLYDPCFKELDNKIICGITPLDNSKGFELKLTETLPDNKLRADKNSGLASWIVELDNNVICMKFGGTAGDIPSADKKIGDLYFYECNNGSVIVGYIDTSEPVWRVQTTFIKEGGSEYQNHNVLRAWR